MEPSTLSKEVVALGEKLVHELSLESSTNTLGRWMTHHLAELLEKVKNTLDDKAAIKKECAELILKLWSQRDHLPVKYRPLESFESILQAVGRLRSSETYYFQRHANQDEENVSEEIRDWLIMAEEIDGIARDLVSVCINNAINNATIKEKAWLEVGLDEKIHRDRYADIVSVILAQDERVVNREEKFAEQLESFAKICIEIASDLRGNESG